MTIADLEAATRVRSSQIPGEYTLDVPDGWQQGRGAFGGLVFAALVRAVEQHVASPERVLRSLSAELPGPTEVGAVTVRVETLRAGSGVSTLATRLEQNGEVRAHAVAVLGKMRGNEAPVIELEAPAMRPWRDVEPAKLDSFGPTFARHFEFRITGPMPFAGGARGYTEGWVRAREPGAITPAAHIAALVDVWWPSIFSRIPAPRPIGTIAYLLQLVVDPASVALGAPCFHRARELATAEGYSVEQRELWSEDGRLLALNTQTIAIIR